MQVLYYSVDLGYVCVVTIEVYVEGVRETQNRL